MLQGASRRIGVHNKASKADEGDERVNRRWGTLCLRVCGQPECDGRCIRKLSIWRKSPHCFHLASARKFFLQGWGTTIVIGVAGRATVVIRRRYLLTGCCMNGTLYGSYKPKTDLPELVQQYLRKMRLQKALFFRDLYPEMIPFELADYPSYQPYPRVLGLQGKLLEQESAI